MAEELIFSPPPEEEKDEAEFASAPDLVFSPPGDVPPLLQFIDDGDPALDKIPSGSFMDALEAVQNFEMGSDDPLFAATRAKAREVGGKLKELTIAGGQKTREGLKFLDEANLVTKIPGVPTTVQLFDVAGQIPSSIFEQAGKIYEDFLGTEEGNNLLYHVGRTLREATKIPDEELAQYDLGDKFGYGLAQTAGFVAGGFGLKELGLKSVGAISAWLGTAVAGQAGREDAIRHGAEPWQADIAYWVNSVVGASEGLPIGMALSKLDDISGGVFSNKLKSKAGQLTRAAITGAITEGLQEMGQTYGENYTAKELARYDPTRSLGENIMEATTVGGSVGLLLNLTATALSVRQRGRDEAQLRTDIEERVLKPLGIKSLEDIGEGGFTPLSQAYFDVLKGEQEVKATYERLGRPDSDIDEAFNAEVEVAEAEALTTFPRISTGSEEVQTVERLQKAALRDKFPDAMLKLLLNEEIDGKTTVAERLAKSDLAVSFTHLLPIYEKLIASTKAKLEADPTGVEAEADKQKLSVYEEIMNKEKELAKHLTTLGEILLPMLPKGEKILLADTTFNLLDPEDRNSDGYTTMFKMGNKNVNVISVNLQNLPQAVGYDSIARTTSKPERAQAVKNEISSILTTYLHEFGHVLAYHQFQSLLNKVSSGTATERENQIWQGLETDYKAFVMENLRSPQGQVLSTANAARGLSELQGMQAAPLSAELSSMVERLSSDELTRPYHKVTRADTVDYIFSMREFFAEEFSKVALGREDLVSAEALPFFKENIEDIRKVMAKASGSMFKPTTPTMVNYAKEHSLKGARLKAIADMNKNVVSDPMVALANAGLLDRETAKRLGGERDKFNRFMDIALTIYQIAELNPHLPWLQNYVSHLEQWKNEVNKNLALAQDRLVEWRNLGDKEAEQLGRLLTDETVGRLPDGGWLKIPRFFTLEEIAKYKLSDKALQLRKNLHGDFKRVLAEVESVLIAAKQQIFAANPIEMTREVAQVKKEFSDMRSKPYFPLMRFGDYTMQVYAKGSQEIEGQAYEDGDIVDWQTFDTKSERDRAVNVHLSSGIASKTTVSSSKLIQPNFSLQGMPLTLLEHLESKLVSVQLDENVKEAIRKVKNDVLPFKSFRKQFQRRKRVSGYSLDAQRAYANYMTAFANHIARVKYDRLFKDDLDGMSDSVKIINRTQKGNSDKRSDIHAHMNEHLNYVMSPVNEFVGLRALGFFWFLGFSVKSAFINLIQVPMAAYPHLAMRHGDGRAVAQLTRAYGTAFKSLMDPKKVDPQVMLMIEQGLKETWLDESLATELALAASEKNLDKSLPRHLRQQATLKISEYASLPFHVAEKLNRLVTAIAAYRLNIADGATHEEAVQKSRFAVQRTMFEYARFARAKFMRGPVGGTVFLFQSFLQNMLFAVLRGDGAAMRMLVVLLMVGGLQGLPFAENILDFVDAAMTALKRVTGAKDPYTDSRTQLRKIMQDLEVNPDLILHGTSASTFGLGNLGEAMGWPIPSIDLSGSLSLGRVIPATEMLRPGRVGSFEKFATLGLERGGGAIISGAAGVSRAMLDQHPDQWKRWEAAMFSSMRGVSRAARYAVRGEEATRSGIPIAGFDMHDPQDQAELVAQSLGFTPRDVSKGWEGFVAQQQAIIYYESWKTSLLRKWNYAQDNNDQEAVKVANADIAEYNKVVPYPEMKIGTESRKASYLSYRKTRQYNEAEIEQNKAFRRMKSDIQEIYESGDTEGKEQ